MAEDDCDRDDRTLFVAGLSDKISEAILYELFYQAGPIERVSIPKDKETDRFKTFGFVTYKHRPSVAYALNIFSGTKLFGRDLQIKNRNINRTRESQQQQLYSQRDNFQSQAPMSLMQGGFQGFQASNDMNPLVPATQMDVQKQLLLMAVGAQSANFGVPMFAGPDMYSSQRQDNAGSHRERYVDRSRHHREENRSNRSKPYRRSRSRSPSNRNRSPDRGSRQHRSDVKSNYSRWGRR